ncbi:MAG: peptidoglycan-associated lipoprotein Pal [Burkholderiales bacterium]
MFFNKTVLVAVLATASIVVVGCGSTPPKPDGGAPIEDRTLGSKPAAGPSGVGSAPTSVPPGVAIDARTGSTGGIDPAVKAGELAKRSVYFAYDSDAVREEFRPMLQAHSAYLQKNRDKKMLLQGNTDERGSREYNLALGQRRAEAVKRTMVLLGVQDAQIEAVSLGEEKPRRTGQSEADFQENRRGDLLHMGEF